jgi:hypothetical protein
MKTIISCVMTVLFIGPVLYGQSAVQRLPITLKGTQISQTYGEPAVTSTLGDASILSAPSNQLVIALNLDSNYLAIEEWDSTLTKKVDRSSLYPGTQAVVWATAEYGSMAKAYGSSGKLITFTATLDSVDDDWDDDGTGEHYGSLTVVGTMQYDPAATLTSRDDASVLTGVVTSVRATLQGALNDLVAGEDTPELQLRKGRLRTTGAAPFYAKQ